MSDQDFDFHRPTQRREAKRFEPPPWERDAFDELHRRKEEAVEEGDSASTAPQSGMMPVAGEQVARRQLTEPTPPESVNEAQMVPSRETPPKEVKPGVDERVVVELMAGLEAEEPSIQPAVQWISLFSALVIAAIGTVMILWGMAALIGSRTTGPMGTFGGAVLLFFGAVAIAGASWLTVRTLRQRGVL